MYRLLKTMKLPKMSTAKPPKAVTSKSDNGVCRNILAQNFDQPAPNLVWVSDFTYIRVGSRFYYLCAILDLYARKVVAYKVSSHNLLWTRSIRRCQYAVKFQDLFPIQTEVHNSHQKNSDMRQWSL